jgi:hypothetical protein
MTEELIHQFFQNFHRIPAFFLQAHSQNLVHAVGMTGITDKMSRFTAGSAFYFFMADCTLHPLFLFQVNQRCTAD